MIDKTRFLVCYDYGQGALWAYVCAESQEQVERKFRDIEIFSEPPEWLTPEEQEKLVIDDIDSPSSWLAKLAND